MVKTENGAKTASCTVTVEEAADLSAERTKVIFDAEADDGGTRTAEPVTFTLYNNTDETVRKQEHRRRQSIRNRNVSNIVVGKSTEQIESLFCTFSVLSVILCCAGLIQRFLAGIKNVY